MAEEKWKTVLDLPTYEISSFGRLRRADTHRLLKGSRHTKGYIRFTLRWAGLDVRKYGHVLVARAFLGECPPALQVNHKDGDKTNNRVTNLEYVTGSANVAHAYDSGLAYPKLKNDTTPKQYFREANRAMYHRRKEQGLCTKCSVVVQGGQSRCEKCLEQMRLRARKNIDPHRATENGIAERQ